MLNKIKIASWCMFDFGSTAFMMNIVSLCFVQWINQNFGSGDKIYGLISSIMYVFCLFLYPVAGEICNRGWKLLPLGLLTILSIAGTFFIGFTSSLLLGAVLFSVAYLTYQIGLTYYNALLDDVTTPENFGIVSGIGVGTRYSGAIFGLIMVDFFIRGDKQQYLPEFLAALIIQPMASTQTIYANGFLPTALVYLIFAIPLFFLVKSKPVAVVEKSGFCSIFVSTWNNICKVLKNKNALWLLLSISLGGAPVYAVVHFMTVFLKEIGGVPDSQLTLFLIVATLFSVIGGVGFGFSLRPFGNKRIFYIILFLWSGILLVGTFVHGTQIMWVLGSLAGMGMGGYWAVSRILILDITPKGKEGEYMALFGIVMVICGILSNVLWPLGVKVAEALALPFTPQRLSTFVLSLLGILGILAFIPVRFETKEEANPR